MEISYHSLSLGICKYDHKKQTEKQVQYLRSRRVSCLIARGKQEKLNEDHVFRGKDRAEDNTNSHEEESMR